MGLFNNQTYINGKQILDIFGVTSETINAWINKRDFPKPMLLTNKSRLWKFSDIDEWILKNNKDSDKGEL
ncbi:AlpA family phage regulatory protein [Alphaproteobacteria bacterium]|nr:AlpA family phage regulatory protein [Alphaproteobacteria bacterium]